MARAFLVIGVGRFGTAMATTLHDLGHEVVAIDRDEAALAAVADHITHAAVVDATDERALAALGVNGFDVVIVAIGEDLEASILATVAARAAGARYVISKADTNTTARILASVGADEIVRPEHDMGARLARQLAAPDEVASLTLGPEHRIVEIDVHDHLQGTLAELRLPARFGIQVIAVHRDDDIHVGPGADFAVAPDDRLVVIGHDDQLAAFRRQYGS